MRKEAASFSLRVAGRLLISSKEVTFFFQTQSRICLERKVGSPWVASHAESSSGDWPGSAGGGVRESGIRRVWRWAYEIGFALSRRIELERFKCGRHISSGMRNLVNFRNLLRTQGPLLGLILFISLIYMAQAILGPEFYFRFMTIPVEVSLNWQLLREGGADLVDWGAFGTVFTAALLHGDSGHLIGNMIFLWIFAALAAELLGHRWMLFVFVFTAITGNLCHIALNRNEFIPCLGASGAVMGFEGLYLAMAVRWRLPDPHVWPIARPIAPGRLAMIGVVGLILDFMGYTSGATGVAYGAHLGGFIGGLLLGGAVVRMPRMALPR